MLGNEGVDVVEKEYAKPGITVHWDSARCIHTGICLRALPAVFDTQRRPWIDVDGGTVTEIAAAVAKCPTGALKFTSDEVSEAAPDVAVARPVRGGPLIIRGPVEIVDGRGETVCHENRVALCRCGNSRNQPFCDNSHRTEGFEEPVLRAPEPAENPDEVCPPQPGFEDG